jgi:hypothetical protein
VGVFFESAESVVVRLLDYIKYSADEFSPSCYVGATEWRSQKNHSFDSPGDIADIVPRSRSIARYNNLSAY